MAEKGAWNVFVLCAGVVSDRSYEARSSQFYIENQREWTKQLCILKICEGIYEERRVLKTLRQLGITEIIFQERNSNMQEHQCIWA